jgi:hypothetical protein
MRPTDLQQIGPELAIKSFEYLRRLAGEQV